MPRANATNLLMARNIPRYKYGTHKASAKQRGIEFDLTFDEWWGLWEPHWAERGRGKLNKCMCRKLDSGGYTVGNVKIDYVCNNAHERRINRALTKGTVWRSGERLQSGSPEIVQCFPRHDRDQVVDSEEDY